MKFTEKIKLPEFWRNFIRIAIPFFIIVIVFSLLWNSWSQIFSGDFAAVAETNFNDGKWQTFFGVKIVVCVIYGLYVTNKNMK
jgi:hypothetical protein